VRLAHKVYRALRPTLVPQVRKAKLGLQVVQLVRLGQLGCAVIRDQRVSPVLRPTLVRLVHKVGLVLKDHLGRLDTRVQQVDQLETTVRLAQQVHKD
jgi:hypothetical protein